MIEKKISRIRYHRNMKHKFLIGYIVAVHAALGLFIWKSDLTPKLMAAVGVPVDANASRVATDQRILLERVDPAVPPGSPVFLGDSITRSLLVHLVEPSGVNLGVGSQTSAQLAEFAKQSKAVASAKKVYLHIGTNDVGAWKSGPSEQDLRAIVQTLPPSAAVVWSTILPREGLEEKIRKANGLIGSLCQEHGRCTLVDTWQLTADAHGSPISGMYVDGVHPTPKGYRLWIQALTEQSAPH